MGELQLGLRQCRAGERQHAGSEQGFQRQVLHRFSKGNVHRSAQARCRCHSVATPARLNGQRTIPSVEARRPYGKPSQPATARCPPAQRFAGRLRRRDNPLMQEIDIDALATHGAVGRVRAVVSCSARSRSARTSAPWARWPTSSTWATGPACACGCWRSASRCSASTRWSRSGWVEAVEEHLRRPAVDLAVGARRRRDVRLRHGAGVGLRQQDPGAARRRQPEVAGGASSCSGIAGVRDAEGHHRGAARATPSTRWR